MCLNLNFSPIGNIIINGMYCVCAREYGDICKFFCACIKFVRKEKFFFEQPQIKKLWVTADK